MLVYRVEHPGDRIGPYQSGGGGTFRHEDVEPWLVSYQWRLRDAHNPQSSPKHQTSSKMAGWCSWYVCGFENIDQLKRWFYGFRKPLREHGFVCSVYDVADTYVCRDGYQVGFSREKATKLKTIRIP